MSPKVRQDVRDILDLCLTTIGKVEGARAEMLSNQITQCASCTRRCPGIVECVEQGAGRKRSSCPTEPCASCPGPDRSGP